MRGDAAHLTVATWNVHGGVGRDRRYHPARIADVVRELEADVVALQEVGERNDENLLSAVVSVAGYHAALGWTCKRWGCDYGNVVLSRFAIRECTQLDLTVPRCEPRGALDVVIDAPARPLRVIATHLGLRPSERRVQVKHLLRALERKARHPTVLTGDVNEWSLWGRPLRWLHAHFGATPSPATFPSHWPLLALDRLWTEPAAMLADLRVHRSPLACTASDHLPLVARLRWPTPTPPPVHVTDDAREPLPQ